ncbi:MAG: alpha/beta hydrolase [Thermoproteota archaeon]|nr:alpha/beta hydrolase [Thermoproteota archaeon]
MVDFDIAIKSLTRHIQRIEALLAFKYRSYNDFLRRGEEPPYELKRVIAEHEEELSFAMGVRRNYLSMIEEENALVSYFNPERHTNIGPFIIRHLEYGPTRGSSISTSTKNDDDDNNVKNVVLLHGFTQVAERWSRILPGLLRKHRRHLRVIIPDIIGFGYGDIPRDVDYTMDFFVHKFLKPFLDNLGISKACIIGSSFGGQIAAEFAIEYRDMVEDLVLVAPAGMMTQSNPTLDRYIAVALNPNPDFQDVYQVLTEMVYDASIVDERTVRDFMLRMRLPNAKYALRSTLVNMIEEARRLQQSGRLSSITAPTLIIWGENDRVIPIQYSEGFRQAIPNNKFVKIPMCGHAPHYETPSIVNRELFAWANWWSRSRG